MVNKKTRQKAQTVIEYSFLIALTVGVLLIMNEFLGRSLQGNIKKSADRIGGEHLSGSFSIPIPESGYRYSSGSVNKREGTDVQYSSVSKIKRNTFSATYEGKYGSVNVITNSRQQIGTVEGETIADSEFSGSAGVAGESEITEDVSKIMNIIEDSSVDPGINADSIDDLELTDGTKANTSDVAVDNSTAEGYGSVTFDEGEGESSSSDEAVINTADVLLTDVYAEHLDDYITE
ncbi:MAG: hypothetical protein WC214_02010 [Candidatus Omnitrophota bacterium]